MLDKRIKYSFAISLSLHILIIGLFGYLTYKDKQNKAFITDIEMVEPVVPEALPVPKQEKPKNIWEFMKMALPVIKKPEPPKDEKLVEITKKSIEKALEVEKKLVDKSDPLMKKTDALKFKELQKEKDYKLADIMKTMDTKKLKELVEQERKITEKDEPLARKSDALKFEEVGLKRAENIKEITAAEKKIDEQRLRELTPAELLTDKKTPIEKTAKSPDLGISLKARVKDDGKIKEIIGTDEERKKVREYLALEEKLVEKVQVKTASTGGGKPVIGYNNGGGSGISIRPEEIKRTETKVNIAPVRKIENAVAQEKIEINKASVELIGPLQSRGIIASYMPKYPEWMKEKGVNADVSVRLFVAPNGAVREDMSVERTSGYSELDKLVMAVLRTWQFEALPKGAPQQEQWGVITFRFKLKS